MLAAAANGHREVAGDVMGRGYEVWRVKVQGYANGVLKKLKN
jgi:hypothetical protein